MAFELTSQFLDYDPEEEHTRALAALAAQTPELNPASQFEAAPPMAASDYIDYGQPETPEPFPTAATSALATAAQPPAAAPPPPSAYQAPEPPPQVDPLEALMRRGEEQKQKQLEAYDAQGAPGPNGWALLADVVFNKGKSIPGILSQADADKRAYREGRQRLLTGGAHSDPVNQMLAMERIRTGQGNLGEREKNRERLAGKDQAKAAQSTENREAFLAQLKNMGAPESELAALTNADEATFRSFMPSFRERYKITDPTMLDGAEELARKREHGHTTGGIQATHENIGTKASDAGEVAGAQAAAQAPHLATRPQTPDQIAADKLQREALDEAKRARGVAEKTRQDGIRQGKEKSDNDWITKYSNDTRKQREAAVLVDELDDIIAEAEKTGALPPGLGAEQIKDGAKKAPLPQWARGISAVLGDSETSAYQSAALENQKKLQRAGTTLYRIDTGASGNAREEIAAEIANATSPYATMPEIKASLGVIRGILQSDIGGEGSAHPDLAGRVLLGSRIKDPGRWIQGYQAAPAAGGGGGMGGDPELGPGQAEVINDEGDAVVEGAEAIPAGNEGFDPFEQVRPQDRGDIPAGGTLGKGPTGPRGKPPAAAAPPKTIGASPPPNSGAPLLPFIVNGKRRMITQEQAEWLIHNKPGAQVSQ